MNLRQKCKKLKAENERLKKQPRCPVFIQPTIPELDVIAYSREYHAFEMHDIPDGVILNDLKRGLAEQLVPYMDIQAYYGFDRSTIRATIKILRGTANGRVESF